MTPLISQSLSTPFRVNQLNHELPRKDLRTAQVGLSNLASLLVFLRMPVLRPILVSIGVVALAAQPLDAIAGDGPTSQESWCNPKASGFYQTVAEKTGWMVLGRQPKKVRDLSECFAKNWDQLKGQGDLSFVVQKSLLIAMEIDPAEFLRTFSRFPAAVDSWLKSLDVSAFTWEDEPPCPLDDYREMLLLRLDRVSAADLGPAESALLQRIKTRLLEIRCRVVG